MAPVAAVAAGLVATRLMRGFMDKSIPRPSNPEA
jgi:hypothetical protein